MLYHLEEFIIINLLLRGQLRLNSYYLFNNILLYFIHNGIKYIQIFKYKKNFFQFILQPS